jgi:hypothetical protein
VLKKAGPATVALENASQLEEREKELEVLLLGYFKEAKVGRCV